MLANSLRNHNKTLLQLAVSALATHRSRTKTSQFLSAEVLLASSTESLTKLTQALQLSP